MPEPNPYKPTIHTPTLRPFSDYLCVQCLIVGFAVGFAVALPICIGLGLCLGSLDKLWP